MKMNNCIMEEAKGLLEYKAPELTELDTGLALVDGMGIGDDSSHIASGTAETNVLFADGDDGEENGTFSLDD